MTAIDTKRELEARFPRNPLEGQGDGSQAPDGSEWFSTTGEGGDIGDASDDDTIDTDYGDGYDLDDTYEDTFWEFEDPENTQTQIRPTEVEEQGSVGTQHPVRPETPMSTEEVYDLEGEEDDMDLEPIDSEEGEDFFEEAGEYAWDFVEWAGEHLVP